MTYFFKNYKNISMARSIREDYEGAWHHVMNRGRNHERIYIDDTDALDFLLTIHKTIERYGIEVHAYSLMPNHYHLLVRAPLGNLSDAMKHLGSTYTMSFNRRHSKDGALFRGRFKSQLVKYEAYLVYLFVYIHLNPLRANLITRIDALSAWTSYRCYLGKDEYPKWLSKDTFLKMYNTPEKIKEVTLRLHQKVESWPAGFQLESGWVKWELSHQDDVVKSKIKKVESVLIDSLVQNICEIAECKRERLMESVWGSKGNIERRFAIWALHKSTYLTQRQIGKQLDMTTYQVAKNIERSKNNSDQFGKWAEIWNRKYPEKVSSVKT